MILSLFRRQPETLFVVETFYGASNGWIARGCRNAAGADRLISWLERIDSLRRHRIIAVEA